MFSGSFVEKKLLYVALSYMSIRFIGIFWAKFDVAEIDRKGYHCWEDLESESCADIISKKKFSVNQFNFIVLKFNSDLG